MKNTTFILCKALGRWLTRNRNLSALLSDLCDSLIFEWAARSGVIECCQCASVASFNFQFPIRAAWQIDNWQHWYWQHYHIGNIQQEHRTTCPDATPQSQYKKVRSEGCFAAHLLFISSSKVWADGVQRLFQSEGMMLKSNMAKQAIVVCGRNMI